MQHTLFVVNYKYVLLLMLYEKVRWCQGCYGRCHRWMLNGRTGDNFHFRFLTDTKSGYGRSFPGFYTTIDVHLSDITRSTVKNASPFRFLSMLRERNGEALSGWSSFSSDRSKMAAEPGEEASKTGRGSGLFDSISTLSLGPYGTLLKCGDRLFMEQITCDT